MRLEKKASPDSRIQMLKPVASSQARASMDLRYDMKPRRATGADPWRQAGTPSGPLERSAARAPARPPDDILDPARAGVLAGANAAPYVATHATLSE